jgi:hypothetical protein
VVAQSLGQGRVFVWIWGIVAAATCLLIVGYLAAAPQNHSRQQTTAPDITRPDIVFVQTPEVVSGPLSQQFPKGSAIFRLNGKAAPGEPAPLSDGFFAAADPQVNFEGTKVLFSGQKRQGERWQIWEMNLDGSNKRQVTECPEDCLRGAYLPGEEIAFTVEDGQGDQRHSYLAVAKADGSRQHPITFGPPDFALETVLRDGRIVATAPWPLTGGKSDGGSRLLYTLRPDGTALESFRCEHRENRIQADAEELEDGSLVFVARRHASGPVGGELEQIRRGAADSAPLGPRQKSLVNSDTPRLPRLKLSSSEVAGAPSRSRKLSAIAKVVYRWPRQLSADELIVSRQEGSANGFPTKFGLYAFHLKTGTVGEKIFADAKNSSIQPVVAAPHAVPKHYWSTLNPESLDGYFISLNSYLAGDMAHGHIATPIARVRVLTVNQATDEEHSLGEAPVESDGSFYVRVAANTPIRFVLLDAKGETIREEHSWVWTRPGEQRGCSGCHGDKALAPENHWPLTLKRLDTPTPLGEREHGSPTSQAK